MKIGIIGATGNAGRALFHESAKRGHQTTAIVRSAAKAGDVLGADAAVLERDAFSLDAEDLAAFDVVVNAFGTAPHEAYRHVDLARSLVELAGETTPRLVFILGAGSLTTGDDDHLFVEDIRNIPGAEAWISIPENQLKELEYLRGVTDVDWVGVSPSRCSRPATPPPRCWVQTGSSMPATANHTPPPARWPWPSWTRLRSPRTGRPASRSATAKPPQHNTTAAAAGPVRATCPVADSAAAVVRRLDRRLSTCPRPLEDQRRCPRSVRRVPVPAGAFFCMASSLASA